MHELQDQPAAQVTEKIKASGVIPTDQLMWPDDDQNLVELFNQAVNEGLGHNMSRYESFSEPPNCFGRMEIGRDPGGFPHFSTCREEYQPTIENLYQQGYCCLRGKQTLRSYGPETEEQYIWNPDVAGLFGFDIDAPQHSPQDYAVALVKAAWLRRKREMIQIMGLDRGRRLAACAVCHFFTRCQFLSTLNPYALPLPTPLGR